MNVIIVGGGAAGLIACNFAAEHCENVILIEKNKKLGKKLRITGKGRCNITNAAEVEDFFKAIPTNSKFMYSALYSFTNSDIINFFENHGLQVKTERGGRVFPCSDNAHDVADSLVKAALKKNVKLVNDDVTEIIVKNNSLIGVRTKSGKKIEGRVILATGGASYPLTGSDGSGYKLAENIGHTVTRLSPSLIPIVTVDTWCKDLAGLALKNIVLSVYDKKNRCIFSDIGEMLFTHFGVSGPLVLSASAHMRDEDKSQYKLEIDLKPGLSHEKLDARILRDFEEDKNKNINNVLAKLMPKALIPIILKKSGISSEKKINIITKEERHLLCDTVKKLTVIPKEFRPLSEAIITSGGINVKEINPSTMESKIIPGLFFAGEIIDVDAYTGGYNLQIAWSTGYLAGIHAAEDL